MNSSLQVSALVELLRARYPDLKSLALPAFQRDEVAPKRRLASQMREALGPDVLAELLQHQAYDEVVSRIGRIGRKTPLLYNRVPQQGDLNILVAVGKNSAEFSHQFYRLLYSNEPIELRLRTWRQFTQANHLPCKWSFTTFFLFLSDPAQHIFIKPQATRWFLQFVGQADVWSAQVHPKTYTQVISAAKSVRSVLAPLGATDLIDVQSVVWVAFRESRSRTAQLPPDAQVALDQPPTLYQHRAPAPLVLREDSAEYSQLPHIEASVLNMPYSLTDAAAHLLRSEATLKNWLDALARKKQIIFYGPPGTGKTFAAHTLAKHLIAGTSGFIQQLQLHPNYTYEEFIEGLRPRNVDGQLTFQTIAGRFVTFCERAAQVSQADPAAHCVLILDEINRADLARIFGELLYLLEYRGESITLASGTRFSIPSNVRIIGTMNTADRSIALVDYALRRRFAFVELAPNYEVLRRYHAKNSLLAEALIAVLTDLNNLLDSDYRLGCAYFLNPKLAETLPSIWRHEIEPYLDEYFYARPASIAAFKWAEVAKRLPSL